MTTMTPQVDKQAREAIRALCGLLHAYKVIGECDRDDITRSIMPTPIPEPQIGGAKIVEGLTELRDVLARGESLGSHFKITQREKPDQPNAEGERPACTCNGVILRNMHGHSPKCPAHPSNCLVDTDTGGTYACRYCNRAAQSWWPCSFCYPTPTPSPSAPLKWSAASIEAAERIIKSDRDRRRDAAMRGDHYDQKQLLIDIVEAIDNAPLREPSQVETGKFLPDGMETALTMHARCWRIAGEDIDKRDTQWRSYIASLKLDAPKGAKS